MKKKLSATELFHRSPVSAMTTSRRAFIAATSGMLLLAGCKDFEKMKGQRIDRSKISDPDVLACVNHVEGYIEACSKWEAALPRKNAGVSFPDFGIAGERFKPIAKDFWTGNEWEIELGSFSMTELKHDPKQEWPVSAERITDSAVEVVVSIPDFINRNQRTPRVYRLEKSETDASNKTAWRIRTIFELYEPNFSPNAVPAPPAELADPARPKVPAGVSAASSGPVKTTVRLRPYPDPRVSAQSSNLGGPFLFNQSSAWPSCELHNTPLVGMVQLKKSDIPELPFRDQEEALQVFWCPFDHNDGVYCPLVKTRWLKKEQLTDTGKPNPKITRRGLSQNVPVACRLYPHRLTELPDLNLDNFEEVSERVVTWLKDSGEYTFPKSDTAPTDYEEYRFVGPAVGTKVLGYADWIQDVATPSCEFCKKPMTLLLTVASAEWEHGDLLRPREFSTNVPYNPTGLMLGDVGNVYIFICTDCKERPIKRVFQCS